MSFLSQALAKALDVELMQVPGFSLDQLMELAGLSIAQAVMHVYGDPKTRILALAGPGNNGGDALVACRHLSHFGYPHIEVVYPKTNKAPLFLGLEAQLHNLDIPISSSLPSDFGSKFDLILDGVFGFSFEGGTAGVRPPFNTMMSELRNTSLPVVAIDIPSGWDVERGDVYGIGVKMPAVLVSLTAPKPCARLFTGKHHFLGGRFLTPKMAAKYNLLDLPQYEGANQFVRIPEDHCKPEKKKGKLDSGL